TNFTPVLFPSRWRGVTGGWWPARLQEGLALAAVGRQLVDHRAVEHGQQAVEALAEFAGLAVAHEDRVAQGQPLGAAVADRRLDLAGALQGQQRGPGRQVGPGQLLRADAARGHVAAAQAGVDVGRRAPDDLDREAGRRLVAEGAVVVEQRRREEARSDRDLADVRLADGRLDAARAAAVDDAQR